MAGDKERLKRRIARLKARISDLETAIREHVEAKECGAGKLAGVLAARVADGGAA